MSTAPPTDRRPVGLRRSWLFTAGMGLEAQQLALDSGADVIVADLEEFTTLADRPAARPRVAGLMGRCRARGTVAAVRINRLEADGLADLEGVMPGRPDLVFLPYVESAAQIEALCRALDAAEARHGWPAGSTEVVPTIESALGIVRIQAILATSPRMTACLLAAEDLTADLGAERGPDSLELNHLRARFLVDCRAARVLPIDCPFNYRDPQAQLADLLWARRIGLKAKCAVDPAQVGPIHAVLIPSKEQVAAARRTLALFEAGGPIDGPDAHTARRLLARDAEFKTRPGANPAVSSQEPAP